MKQTLYLGIDLPPKWKNKSTVHFPLVKIIPKDKENPFIVDSFKRFNTYSHVVFTSRNAVSVFFSLAAHFNISIAEIASKLIIAIGQRTSEKLSEYGNEANLVASEETAEGVLEVIKSLDLTGSHFFLPQSSLSRRIIPNWLESKQVAFTACPIYDTVPGHSGPLPDLELFDEIVFTSPSIVNAFLHAYGYIPENKTLSCIGPITQQYLDSTIS